MDDLDLDDIDLENFNFDEVSNKAKQPQKNEQKSNPAMPNADVNRPRLRKIKRPKFHTGPIASQNTGAVSDAQQSISALLQDTNEPTVKPTAKPAEASQGGLIRAGDRPFTPNNNVAPVTTQTPNNMPEFNNDYVTDEEEFVYQGNGLTNIDNKKMIWIAMACLFVGLFLGKIFFSSEQVVRNGLQGVVVNPEVPKGRSRCGIAERTQGCVLYIMNPQRQDLHGRDFYDLASQLTGRQRFVIETGNMRYASVKIKPGNIAQLNIPPLQ